MTDERPDDPFLFDAGRALRVTRAVKLDDWLDGNPAPVFTPGMVVHEYKGVTYGCITEGVAVTLKPGRTPFYEVPWDAVEPVEGTWD